MEYCPTEDMIGDFLIKSTQGLVFKRFREQLMGVNEAQDAGLGNSKKIVNIKYVNMVRRPQVMQHLPTVAYCNGFPGNIHSTSIDTLIIEL